MSDTGLGFLNAFLAARKMKTDKARQDAELESMAKDRELKDIQLQSARRAQALEDGRRNDIAAASAAAPGGKPPRSFEAMQAAATKRLAAGDLDGYNDLTGKAAAAQTMYYTTAFNSAYRSGDRNAALAILNEFPNGQSYQLEDAEDGSVVMKGFTPDGKQIGARKFKSTEDFFADIQGRINPGDIAKTIRESMDAEARRKLLEAQTGQANAAAESSRANTATENATRDGKVKAQEANIRQSDAAAKASLASAANAGTTPEMRNFGFRSRLSPEQQAAFDSIRGGTQTTTDPQVVNAQKALLDAYTDPLKRSTLSPEQIKEAEGLLGMASGQGLIRKADVPRVAKPGPRPENLPQTPAPTNPAERKAGMIYDTPRGKMKWTGTGWLPAN